MEPRASSRNISKTWNPRYARRTTAGDNITNMPFQELAEQAKSEKRTRQAESKVVSVSIRCQERTDTVSSVQILNMSRGSITVTVGTTGFQKPFNNLDDLHT